MIPAYLTVGAEDAPRFGIVLHGVLGAGHNFRSFIKRLTDARPEYRFVLVDLRHHGKSQGAPPPHTLEACAEDLLELTAHLNVEPDVVIGHSLGGKVALIYGQKHVEPRGENAPSASAREKLRQVWALDSDPGVQVPGGSHQVKTVMAALRAHRGPFTSRQEALDSLAGEGLSSGLTNWLSTNLEKRGDVLVWRLDLESIDELLDDYFGLDLWGFLERVAAEDPALLRPLPGFHLLVAENSDRWSGTMKERAETLPQGDAFTLHELPRSGHWVHVDNPDGLLEILSSNLP